MAEGAGNSRAQTAPASVVEKRVLNDSDAFKKFSCRADPVWTMGGRDSIYDRAKYALKTEFGPDTTDNFNVQGPFARSQKVTMKARWTNSLVAGAWVPAPGHYPGAGASTMSKSHPTLPVAGRTLGSCWGAQERKTGVLGPMGEGSHLLGKYDVKTSQTDDRIRDCTVRGKTHTVPVTGKGGIWAECTKGEAESERKIYDARGFSRKGGVAPTLSFTMNARPPSVLIPRGDPTPAPGQVSLYASGKVKRSPSFGWGTSSRWAKEPEPRPY